MNKPSEKFEQAYDNFLAGCDVDTTMLDCAEFMFNAGRESVSKQAEPVAIVVSRQYEDGSHAGHLLEWRGRNEADDFPEGTEFYAHPAPAVAGDAVVFEAGKAAGRQEVKDAQSEPDFWSWVRKAYREPESTNFTIHNMEVAYQAGRAAQPVQPNCGACPGDGKVCRTSCRLADESPVQSVQPVGAQGELVAHYGIVDPDYARVFTQARCIAWQYGYACVMQGSFTRDLDLLMVPWTEQAKDNREQLLKLIAMACDLRFSDGKEDVIQSKLDFTQQPHGRTSCSLHFPKFGDRRWIDVSFFPAQKAPAVAVNEQMLMALKSTGLFLHHCWCDVQMNDYSFGKLGKQMEIVDAAIAAAEAAKGGG